jgi:hypothetical protein
MDGCLEFGWWALLGSEAREFVDYGDAITEAFFSEFIGFGGHFTLAGVSNALSGS